jgi:hypothetical protein
MADATTGKTGYLQHTDATAADLALVLDNDNAHWDDLIDKAVATASALPMTGNWFGRRIIASDVKATYRWNGTAWKPWESEFVTLTLAQAIDSGLASTGSSSSFQWRYRASRVLYKGAYSITASGGGWTNPVLLLPVPAVTPAYAQRRYSIGGGDLVHGAANYPLNVFASGSSTTKAALATAAIPAGALTNSAPVVTAIGDSISFELEYDPA